MTFKQCLILSLCEDAQGEGVSIEWIASLCKCSKDEVVKEISEMRENGEPVGCSKHEAFYIQETKVDLVGQIFIGASVAGLFIFIIGGF